MNSFKRFAFYKESSVICHLAEDRRPIGMLQVEQLSTSLRRALLKWEKEKKNSSAQSLKLRVSTSEKYKWFLSKEAKEVWIGVLLESIDTFKWARIVSSQDHFCVQAKHFSSPSKWDGKSWVDHTNNQTPKQRYVTVSRCSQLLDRSPWVQIHCS